jgi:hypothetical protein
MGQHSTGHNQQLDQLYVKEKGPGGGGGRGSLPLSHLNGVWPCQGSWNARTVALC